MTDRSRNAGDRSPSATIAATATAVPEHLLTRESVKTYMRKVFDLDGRRLDAMMTVIDNAQVSQRHSIFPVEYFVEPRPLQQTNGEYQEHAVRLGREAAEACLAMAGMTAAEVDAFLKTHDGKTVGEVLEAWKLRDLAITELRRELRAIAAEAAATDRAARWLRALLADQ